MRRVAMVAGALLWAVCFFLATFWLTFPSDTLANRIRYEVPLRLGSDWSAEVESVSPWWAGLSVRGLKLYQGKRGEDGVEAPQLAALVDEAAARIAFKSLFRGAPYVKGRATLGEGDVWWELGTVMEGEGNGAEITDVVVRSAALPLAYVAGVLGAPVSLDGDVALEVDLRAGESGMRDASGSLALDGADLVISDVEIPGIGPLGMDVPISSLAIHAEVDQGKATFEQSRVVSDLFTLELKGDVTLRDPLDRSSVDVEAVLSNLGPALAAFEGFMGDARTSDGSYRFQCRGIVSRMNENSCTMVGERRSSRAGAARSPSTTSTAEQSEAERTRRQEIQERIRKRREERERRRSTAESTRTLPEQPPVDDLDEDEELLDEEEEEEPFEELPPDEELPPEDEEPLE